MKAHLITVLVVDFEDCGAEAVTDLLVGNRRLSAQAIETKTADIGEWDDDHPLNRRSTVVAAVASFEWAKP